MCDIAHPYTQKRAVSNHRIPRTRNGSRIFDGIVLRDYYIVRTFFFSYIILSESSDRNFFPPLPSPPTFRRPSLSLYIYIYIYHQQSVTRSESRVLAVAWTRFSHNRNAPKLRNCWAIKYLYIHITQWLRVVFNLCSRIRDGGGLFYYLTGYPILQQVFITSNTL